MSLIGSVGINAAGLLADADASRGPGNNPPGGGGTFERFFESMTYLLPRESAVDGRCDKTTRFESSGSFANNFFDRSGLNFSMGLSLGVGLRIKRGSFSGDGGRICNCGLG